MELLSIKGHILEKGSRASMLKYYSEPLRLAKTFLMGIPVLMGAFEESQTLTIQVIDAYCEQTSVPIASIRVVLEPRTGYPRGFGIPELYHAEIKIVAHFPWVQEVVSSWIQTLHFWSGLGLFVFESILLLGLCQKIFPLKGRRTHIDNSINQSQKE